ncbi:MAG TPA: hypothetical protein VFA18_22715, partial [Gemmataceae bacterium]|nr:hypothetical protein [Gemmataceae bacterium]
VPGQSRVPNRPAGRRANVVQFPALATSKVRVLLHHAADGKSGLTEFEVWGDAKLPVQPAPQPAGDHGSPSVR